MLVPGAAGRAEVLAAERAAALAASRVLVEAGPEVIVVLVPGAVRVEGTRLRWSLAAAGVPDRWTGAEGPADVTDLPAAVGLWLLETCGWHGPVEVVGVDGAPDAARRLTAARRTAVLLVGGGSVRRGPDAPWPDSPDAQQVDDALVGWLESLGAGRTGPEEEDGAEPALWSAPAADVVERHHLDVVGPATVLASAAEARLDCTGITASAPLGATYLIGAWRPTDPEGKAR